MYVCVCVCGRGEGALDVREDFVNCAFPCKSLYCPTYQAAFSVRYNEDLWHRFPNHSVYWRTIEAFGVKRCKTEVMPGFGLYHMGLA